MMIIDQPARRSSSRFHSSLQLACLTTCWCVFSGKACSSWKSMFSFVASDNKMMRKRPWTGRAEPRGESGEMNTSLLTQPRHRHLLVSAPCICVIRQWCRCSKWYGGADSGGALLPWRCRWASITLSGLLGNCFSAPRLFVFCNWLVRLKVSEVSTCELIVSVRLWVLCSAPPTWFFLLQVISHRRCLSHCLFPPAFFSFRPFLSSQSARMAFFKWFIRLQFHPQLGFEMVWIECVAMFQDKLALSWTFSDES